ncbi:NTPase KAP family P-loop domain-containing protein 1-like [Dendrobates tinctorius]|uniref:NTPase KAP family P-loop domain-containing protein 1-like n=1 Tax=Dendrobates tinctorius TaxID=92724 RepID=UPI003CCA36EC
MESNCNIEKMCRTQDDDNTSDDDDDNTSDDEYTLDDDFCKALAWTLYKGKCPMTVGLYVPWGRCKDALLAKIRENICKIKFESEEKSEFEEKKMPKPSETMPLKENHYNIESENHTDESRRLTVKELFKLVFLMLFYEPKFTTRNEELKRRHNIFIKFSAWHCIGCDHPWAGLVTTLCDAIEDKFGLIPISIYRAVHMEKESTDEKELKEWVPKKILHIPVWCMILFIFVILIGALLLKLCLYNYSGEFEDYNDPTDYILYITMAIFGSGSLLLSGTIIKVIRNCIVTQKGKLIQKMKRTDMSAQLGFMNDVKEEIEILTSYLHLMEMYQKRKIIVIIEITKLDKCLPNRAVEVLHAINVLLSNPDAPFISILAVDPGIIVDCVEKSDLLKGMANNGFLFLNQIVTLPFSAPQMNKKTKKKHLKNIIYGKKIKIEKIDVKSFKRDVLNVNQYIHNQMNAEQRDFIHKALTFLCKPYSKYLGDNVINMNRIVSTIITVSLMITDEKLKMICPKKVTRWVILAAQWPCALSWILQCIEDEQQRGKNKTKLIENEQLWYIYEMSLETLHANKKSLKQLMDLDGDPEIFYDLLNDEEFTVKDANILMPYTINLNPTIQRKIELLQGSFNLLRFRGIPMKKMDLLPMKKMDLLKMNINAVCERMKKLEFKNHEHYVTKINEHNLNGKALLYSENMKIRKALGMNLGDWVQFRDAFLSLPTPNVFY